MGERTSEEQLGKLLKESNSQVQYCFLVKIISSSDCWIEVRAYWEQKGKQGLDHGPLYHVNEFRFYCENVGESLNDTKENGVI